MELIILGSGGCQIIPRPCCQCKVCKEARLKGRPYERLGSALFIKDSNTLIDTPEEISVELNRADIKEVDNVFYTHKHPDHTKGMRVFEQLKKNWLTNKVSKPVNVFMPEKVYDDIFRISSIPKSSYFDYYEKGIKIIKTKKIKRDVPVIFGKTKITPVKVNEIFGDNVFIYVIEKEKKKVVYAICDFKMFPIKNKYIQNPDILIIQNGYFEGPLKDGAIITKDSPLRKELYSFDETINIGKKIKAKKIIFSHIEELYGKSYDDLKKIEKKYKKDNIQFAYDGMKIKL